MAMLERPPESLHERKRATIGELKALAQPLGKRGNAPSTMILCNKVGMSDSEEKENTIWSDLRKKIRAHVGKATRGY
jgi:hypothetical protein